MARKKRKAAKSASKKNPQSNDHAPDREEDDKSDHDHGSDSEEGDSPLNVEDIKRKIEILSEYPLKPHDYFAQRAAEISISQKGIDVVRTMFTPDYLPKDLTDICISYYDEKVEIMVERTHNDFELFANGKIIDRLMKQTPPSGGPQLGRLLTALHSRGPAFLWWFSLRSALPLCIPLHAAELLHAGGCCLLLDDEKKEVAGVRFVCEENTLFIGLPNTKHKLEWRSLMDSIPHEDLIGPCLNTSTVTLDQLTSCSVQLEARTKKSKDKWLESLFALHRAYAAIGLWISDERTYEYTDDREGAQTECRLEWNRFYRKYKCGHAFKTPMKNEHGVMDEEAYLCYA